MRRVLNALISLPAIVLFSVTVLSLALWFLGPLLGVGDIRPLDEAGVRGIAIGALYLVATIVILVVMLRRRAQDGRMATEIAAAVDPADLALKAEMGEVRGRMEEALTLLRRSKLGGRFGRRHLYQLPWYVMIGPPGAGKTTAIVNSGVTFPLADQMGRTAVGGVGGTRNCDWWFTNEAVLIDTAGRYTTQDSDSVQDQKAWDGFLDILKKYRARQPINGALVAISLSDLSLLDDPARRAHAGAIRKRLSELRARLGVRFPVYVLFTKADLIAGFAEFFETLGKDAREQVWGFTLPLPARGEAGSPVAAFEAEFDALLRALNDQSLERMQQETDPSRRSLIHGLPQQLASLRGVAQAFLAEVFQDSRFEDRQLLRGVYLTSGTQEGTPIDRLMMGMARTFGIGRQAIGSGSGQGRSYFLTRLLQGVVFPEAGLVSADDRVERRYRWIVRGGIAAAAMLAIGFGIVWTLSYLGNRTLVAAARAQVGAYQTLVQGITVDPVSDTDLPRVVPALNILRDMPGNPAQGDPEPPTALTWGLYQGGAIGTEAAQTYRGALNQLLLPRLLLRLETQMAGNLNNPDLLYEALKVYLMLGLQGPMDADRVTQWLTLDWSIAYPDDGLRRDLAGHLAALLGQPMQAIALNGPLVDQVQGLLAETPVATRVYAGIVKSPAATALPDWRVLAAGGPATARVLVRPSGEPLTAGVDGIYTYAGFHDVFLPAALDVAQQVTRESWVLGPRGETLTTPQNIANVSRDVIDLYYTDYVTRWERVLGDLDVVPMTTVTQAVETINVLSGPASPIRNILKSVSDETRLTEIRAAINVEAGAAGVADVALDELQGGVDARTQTLLQILQAASPRLDGSAPAEQKPGAYVETRFQWLHDFVVAPEGVPSELDNLMGTMTEVYGDLNRLAVGGGSAVAAASADGSAAARLMEATTRLPDPMKRWASQVSEGGATVATGGARAQLNALWQARVLPICEKTLAGRYPFNRSADSDVTIQDFARLFAPNGLIDAFFTENLFPFVDATSNPWKWKRVQGKDLGISDGVLQQFQLAAEIRDSFFLSAALPSITFDMKPSALDPNVQQVILEVDGQTLDYAHGPQETTPMTWPGTAGGRTRIAFTPETAGSENQMSREGPWAWFRMLDAAEVRRTNTSDQLRVIFNLGGRIAVFQLRAGSAINPFSLTALSGFRCPRSL